MPETDTEFTVTTQVPCRKQTTACYAYGHRKEWLYVEKNRNGTGAAALRVVFLAVDAGKKKGYDRKESRMTMESNGAVNERKMTELPATEAPVAKAPSGGSDAARLMLLVNPWHKLPQNYTVDLTDLNGGHQIATLCYPALQQMMDDARAAGLHPLICSSFRTWQKQERLYENKVATLMQKGYGRKMAETAAAAEVAVPGTSEHQLGLALDIVDESNQNLDESQESTKVQKWLMEQLEIRVYSALPQ